MRKLYLAIVFLLISTAIFAQEKSAFKASMSSLLLPGGGQIYNGAYIKAATVIGFDALYTINYFYHKDKADDYKKRANDPDEANPFYYENLYNDYYERQQNDLWWLGIITILSVADAYVDAKLYNFDEEKKRIDLLFEKKSVGIKFRF